MRGEQYVVEGARMSSGHALADLPDAGQFADMLASAAGASGLHDLRRLVSAWQAVAQKCSLAFEESMRLAIYRLRVERALGGELAQTVSRGGFGSKSHGATSGSGGCSSPLPDGVSKHDARRYRQLAAISDSDFSRYLAHMKQAGRLPTSAGARRFAGTSSPGPAKRSRRRGRAEKITLPSDILERLTRIMEIDVVVGEETVPAKRRVQYSASPDRAVLRGNLLVCACAHPEKWLPALVRLRERALVEQAVVVAPAEVWAPWFGLVDGNWRCCFLAGVQLRGVGVVLLHHGARAEAFSAVLGDRGWVGSN